MFDLPQEAFFMLSNCCNVKCLFCSGDYYSGKAKKYISIANFTKMAKNLRLERMKAVVLSGGEPLMNPDFLEIVSFLYKQFPHIDVIISTNGVLLNKQIADRLIEYNIKMISVSLNAGRAETYRNLFNVDRFNDLITNIKYYQNLRIKRMGLAPNLNLSFVASYKNIRDLLEFIQLAHNLGVQNVSSSYCRFYPENIENGTDHSQPSRLFKHDSLYYHQEMSNAWYKAADELADKLDMSFSREPLFGAPIMKSTCHFPFESIVVGVEGEIYPCCGGEELFRRQVADGSYDFGNALISPIEDFWNSGLYGMLRATVLNPYDPIIQECTKCSSLLKFKGHLYEAHFMQRLC